MQVTDHSPWVGALTGGMEWLGGHSLRTQTGGQERGQPSPALEGEMALGLPRILDLGRGAPGGHRDSPTSGFQQNHTSVPHCFLVGGALAPLQGRERGSEKHSVAPRET